MENEMKNRYIQAS